MNIIKKLETWQKEGFINKSQADKIKKFETAQKKPTLMYMLLFLSAFCIGVGIVSLIASNWAAIPASVKLLADFTLLASLAYGIYYSTTNNKPFAKEALIILYAIMLIATIGLVAQIYHLKSNGYSAALFWSLLTIPLFFLTRKPILPFIWFPVFNFAFFSWIFDKFPRIEVYMESIFAQNDFVINGYYLLIFISLCAAFKNKISYITKPVLAWLSFGIVLSAISLEFKSSSPLDSCFCEWVLPYQAILGLLALSSFAAYFYRKTSFKYFFLAIVVLMLFSLVIEASGYSEVVRAASTFSILALLMTYAHKSNRAKLFNFAGALVAIRIFIVYIQVFGSLLTTGLGLIISGLVLLLIAIAWHKISTKISAQIKEKKHAA